VNASVFKNKILCDWDNEFEFFMILIFLSKLSIMTYLKPAKTQFMKNN
jgi:hypothetical protein